MLEHKIQEGVTTSKEKFGSGAQDEHRAEINNKPKGYSVGPQAGRFRRILRGGYDGAIRSHPPRLRLFYYGRSSRDGIDVALRRAGGERNLPAFFASLGPGKPAGTLRGLEASRCNAITGLLRGLIEDIDASAQCDTPWRELIDKGVRQVDLPALLHQPTQRIDDSVALVERAALARGVQISSVFS
jgi:hypothetical protein